MTCPEIRVTGHLGRDAEARCSAANVWWLYLEIHQGTGSLAVAAVKPMGQGHAAAIAASSTARQLRRGTPVTVRAARYSIKHSPTPHIELVDVSHIDYRVHASSQEVEA